MENDQLLNIFGYQLLNYILKMREVYVMVPLMRIDEELQMETEAEKILKISRNQFTIHQIFQNLFTIQIDNFTLSFQELDQIIQDKIDTDNRFKILNNIVSNYQSSSYQNSLQSSNFENLVRKAKKYKESKEENKKLRKLLQIQLQNTEKVREETQNTMKILKEEFDALVLEMNKNTKDQLTSRQNIDQRSINPH